MCCCTEPAFQRIAYYYFRAQVLTYSLSVYNENMQMKYAADVVRPGYFHAGNPGVGYKVGLFIAAFFSADYGWQGSIGRMSLVKI